MAVGVSGRTRSAGLAVAAALSAAALAVPLAGCGAPAQAIPASAVAVGASPAAASPAAASRAASPPPTPGWRVVATEDNVVQVGGLSASGNHDAWLTEAMCGNKSCGLADLAGRQLRWNGASWRSVAVPAAYARGIVVPASPAGDWIVGATSVLRWTGKGAGTATALGKNVAIVTGVAPAADDAWFFGGTTTGGPNGAGYALRFSDGSWRPMRVPFVGQGASASSPANVWVSGYQADDDAAGVMAFDGQRWRTVPLPPLPSSLIYTGSGNIATASRSSVWLELQQTPLGGGDSTPYLLHWTGSTWTSMKIPYGLDDLGGAPIAQDGRGGVWLSLADIRDPHHTKAYLVHYLNGSWTRVPVPTTGGDEVVGLTALGWIPGTRSLVGAAVEVSPASLKSPGQLLILRYGA